MNTTIVKIEKNSNGSHNNQTFVGSIPDGWAFIPEGMETPNFPFGEVEAEDIDGIMTVTKWTAGEFPPPPEPEPQEPTEEDDINAMLIDHELRIMDLELGITEE